jgi:hypothetical protein
LLLTVLPTTDTAAGVTAAMPPPPSAAVLPVTLLLLMLRDAVGRLVNTAPPDTAALLLTRELPFS